MNSPAQPRPYLNPYLAGALLGVVLFLSFFITGGGLGASGALSHIQTGVMKWFAPGHVDHVAYFADMAGGKRSAWANTQIYLVVGALLGGLASGLLNGRVKLETLKGPRISVKARWVLAFVGGIIMAYGARFARGCTSGQALSGGALMSVGAWAFMLSVFAGGYGVAWMLRRQWR